MRTRFCCLALGLLLSLSLLGHAADDVPASSDYLGHGINLGNFLEAPKEGDWGGTLTEDDFAIVKKADFATVRVPIRWSAHVEPDAPYTIDPVFMARIDWVVAQAEKNGLRAILDYHNDDALMNQPDTCGARFVSTWKQIAEHFQNAPPTIFFELLNEPKEKMDDAHWNPLVVQTLAAIRPTNPTREIVIGPVHWNSIGALPGLVLPTDDPNLIVTVHYYDPMPFTHQGASWVKGSEKWMGTTWPGTDDEKAKIQASFQQARQWGQDHHRPMFLGEFGAFKTGDMDSRARWTTTVDRTAEANGLAWAYWEFRSGFGAYDPVVHDWRKPLLDALLPPAP